MFKKVIDQENINKVEHLLDKSDKIVIVTHLSPDGDAIGSSLGLYHYLVESGNDVNVIVPNDYPYFLSWMKGIKEVLVYERYPDFAQNLIEDADLIFCLDFNILKRIGKVGDLVGESKAKKILIDHHPDPSNAFNVVISHPEISSTSELIFRLICRLGDFDKMSKPSAEAIYTGMMTDTGGFTYNSNNPQIYYIIGQLLLKGIDKDQIYSNVYNEYSADRFRMLGLMLSDRMKIYDEYGAALIWLTEEDQKKYNSKKGDTEGFANIPLRIKDVTFSVFIREDENMIKISLRSLGSFPTNKFSGQCFNGGGHLNASGGEFFGSIDEAINVFEKALPEYKELLIKNKTNLERK